MSLIKGNNYFASFHERFRVPNVRKPSSSFRFFSIHLQSINWFQSRMTPPLPPLDRRLVVFNVKAAMEELNMAEKSISDMSAMQRILWLTLPENRENRYELFLRVANLCK